MKRMWAPHPQPRLSCLLGPTRTPDFTRGARMPVLSAEPDVMPRAQTFE